MTRAEINAHINTLYRSIKPALPDDESGNILNELFEETLDALEHQAEYIFVAEQLLLRLITFYPHLTPIIPRELLWSIGGSCLSFMEDDEIETFANKYGSEATHH